MMKTVAIVLLVSLSLVLAENNNNNNNNVNVNSNSNSDDSVSLTEFAKMLLRAHAPRLHTDQAKTPDPNPCEKCKDTIKSCGENPIMENEYMKRLTCANFDAEFARVKATSEISADCTDQEYQDYTCQTLGFLGLRECDSTELEILPPCRDWCMRFIGKCFPTYDSARLCANARVEDDCTNAAVSVIVSPLLVAVLIVATILFA